MDIGERIKKRRRELDISQEKLAELVDVHENTIRKWEQGTRSPDAQKLNLLASALGTTVGALMGETESEPPETPLKQLLENLTKSLPIKEKAKITDPLFGNEREYDPNDDLDLGFWGSVAEKAKRAARSGDKEKIALITPLVKAAFEVLSGAETSEESQEEKSKPRFIGIQGNNNVKNNVNIR